MVRFPVLVILAAMLGSASAHADQSPAQADDSPVHASDTGVKRGPIPAWVHVSDAMPVPEDAGGLVFVRRQDTLVHLDEQGQAQFSGFRTRILHPRALELGNLSITWNPSSGPPVVHDITIHRGAESIDVLKEAKFEILRREDQLETAVLNGNLTAVLRVPDLRVGDELEVDLTVRQNDPTLRGNNAGLLLLGPVPPPGRFHLGISWTTGQQPDIRPMPDMAAAAQQRSDGIDYRFDNPPIRIPPKDAPPRYQWQRVVEYSDFPKWPDVSRYFAPLFTTAAKLRDDSPVRQEAARIARANAQPMDRARAALKLVQQDVRYVYVGLNGGNLTPATADETWQRRYGDCKGKTALLLALLGELGIEGEPVLASNSGIDDGLDQRLPSPYLFDHVLVRAHIDGKTWWLDGTLPSVAGPSIDPDFPYRWVLPVTTAGSALEHLKWRPPTRPDDITLYEMDQRPGFDKPAKVTVTTIRRGLQGLAQYVQFSGLTPDQLLGSLRQQSSDNSWQSIDSAKWHYDEKARASILTMVGTRMVDWQDDGDGARSIALPGGGFNPPDRRARPADQDQDLPYYNKPGFDCHVTTLRLPESTHAKNWSFKPDYDMRYFGVDYHRATSISHGAIRMIRGSRTGNQEIDAATARKDNVRIASFDNSMAWVSYDPAGDTSHPATETDVPATYDIDWSAEDVPCLAKAPAR